MSREPLGRNGHTRSIESSARYRERGATVLRTDLLGAVRVELPALPGQPIVVRSQAERRRYWSERGADAP